MGQFYRIEKIAEADGIVELKVGFGEQALHTEILPDAIATLAGLGLTGGELIKLNGPMSLPVAMALAHGLCHLYSAVAVFVPMEKKYFVCISHNPALPIGPLNVEKST